MQNKLNDNFSYVMNFALLVAAVIMFVLMSVFYNLNGDEREHLSSSYMVYQGMVPYRDFFQHHHPLTWYVFAPFFKFFGESSAIYWAMRALMLGVAAATGYYLFKIGRILGASVRMMYAGLAIWLSFYYVKTYGVEFRPDNWMMLFCLAGTSYFFQYLKEKRARLLQISFALFFVALLFLQKIIFFLFPMGCVCLWLLWRKEICWQDVAKALVFPVIAVITIVLGLYAAGELKNYWELNWLLNLKISGTSLIEDEKLIVFWPGGVAAVWLICCAPYKEWKILGWLYLLLTGQLLFHRPWFGQYLLLYYPFLVLVLVLALSRFWQWKYHPLILLVGLVWLIWTDATLMRYYMRSHLRIGGIAQYTDYVLAHTKEDDLILGDAGDYTGGLRLPASGYYWYSFTHMVAMDHYYFKHQELPDFGQIIKDKRPKIIINSGWHNCLDGDNGRENLGCTFWRNKDFADLHEHYDDVGFVYVRKY